MHSRFHVRVYLEEGTTTTPFDMVVLNKISRLHLCFDVLRYVPGMFVEGAKLVALCTGLLAEHEVYIRERCDNLPEITDWVWSE